MTKKGKSTNNTSSLQVARNGTMATTTGAGRVKNIKRSRHFLSDRATVILGEQTLSASQSLYPVGSQYAAGTLLFSADQLSINAQEWIQKYDKYTIDEVEVFCTMNSEITPNAAIKGTPVEVWFYEDTDADPATQTSWIRVQDRDNLGKVVLNSLNPSVRLCSFKPTLSLAAGADTQNPANLIPQKGQFVDALSLNQKFSGLRLFAACSQTDVSGTSYRFSVKLHFRAKVTAMEPL